jgi:hypothetical protein
MTTDPAPYILAAAIIGSMIGFFGCALLVSRRIREAERESYWEGYYAANRENNAHSDDRWLLTPQGERNLAATQNPSPSSLS